MMHNFFKSIFSAEMIWKASAVLDFQQKIVPISSKCNVKIEFQKQECSRRSHLETILALRCIYRAIL